MDEFVVNRKEYVNKTFRLPKDLVDQLQMVAQINNVSLTQLVINCCEYALKNLKQTD